MCVAPPIVVSVLLQLHKQFIFLHRASAYDSGETRYLQRSSGQAAKRQYTKVNSVLHRSIHFSRNKEFTTFYCHVHIISYVLLGIIFM